MYNMSRGFMNTVDAQIVPGDVFSLDMVLVDQRGTPLNLRDGVTTKTMRVAYFSRNGWFQTFETPSANIIIIDADKGYIRISMEGNEFVFLNGYQYIVQVKDPGQDDRSYQSVARGKIGVINL